MTQEAFTAVKFPPVSEFYQMNGAIPAIQANRAASAGISLMRAVVQLDGPPYTRRCHRLEGYVPATTTSESEEGSRNPLGRWPTNIPWA